jgi:hypothetical protein
LAIELEAHANVIAQGLQAEDDISDLEGTAASPMVAIGPERMNDRAAHAGMVAESAAGRRRSARVWRSAWNAYTNRR